MAKVWVVIEGESCEGSRVHGVFSSRAAAVAFVEVFVASDNERTSDPDEQWIKKTDPDDKRASDYWESWGYIYIKVVPWVLNKPCRLWSM